MPDLAAGDLTWLIIVAIVAGLIRGFSGFGTGLIYVPLAGTVLPPIWVLITLTVMDMIGPLPNLPRALREGRPREVGLLGAGALIGLIPGLWLLDRMAPDTFRWVVACLCLVTVALMASGWRWTGRMSPGVIGGVGVSSGLLGGVAGLPGPLVVLTYMAAPLSPAVIRANVLMYLVLWDFLFGGVLLVQGRLSAPPVMLGALLIVPYLAANMLGARLFDPSRERLYRAVAYVLVATAAIASLPVWET